MNMASSRRFCLLFASQPNIASFRPFHTNFMPPGPVFNWLCVASSACDILVRVARVRAAQIASEGAVKACAAKKQYKQSSEALGTPEGNKTTKREQEHFPDVPDALSGSSGAFDTENALKKPVDPLAIRYYRFAKDEASQTSRRETSAGPVPRSFSQPAVSHEHAEDLSAVTPIIQNHLEADARDEPPLDGENISIPAEVNEGVPEMLALESLRRESEPHRTPSSTSLEVAQDDAEVPPLERDLQSSKVPSSRIGRLFHYGGLAASLGYGAASELIRRTASPSDGAQQQSVMMTEANITRLVSKLSQMRGAALKLGQFLSIQDTHVLPPDVDKIFRRVQDGAHYMPDWQMEVPSPHGALGPSWSSFFTSFDRIPFAAASIGQVHAATLAAHVSPTGAEARVAVKVQFPNMRARLRVTWGIGRMLPKGLFLDRTMEVMKQELADECSYTREASFIRAFGAPERLGGDERFKVPWVWDGSTEACCDGVCAGRERGGFERCGVGQGRKT
ncbi:ABC1 family-domain-containing protein, partial [Mycena leptocephala]